MWGKVITLVVIATVLTSANAAFGQPHGRPTTVAKDPAGDWAADIGPGLAPVGDTLGQDLIAAAITAHASEIDFSITTTSLPETADRLGAYVWDMQIDGKWWRLVNIHCDPTQYITGSTPVPVDAPESCVPEEGTGTYFEVMKCGDPRVVNILVNCSYHSSIEADVDTAAATITISVPKKVMKIRAGTVISPMKAFDGSISTSPAVPHSASLALPSDVMVWKKAFRVH